MKRYVRRILLPAVFVAMALGFYTSANFQEIAGGVAIFLFGMLTLEEGFNLFGGGVLERMLSRATKSVSRSVLFGATASTLMQSSTLVSVISISFLSAGLMTLAGGIGVIAGANLGSSTGAWLIAGLGLKINIAAFALPILALAIILVFQKSKPLRGAGHVLVGVGFFFLGIHYMKEGFDSFSEQFDLTEYAMGGVGGLLLYTLIGFIATAILQSSHATMVLVITALAAGQLTYENALALSIGANVGTTVTAVLGSMTANYQGRRLALAHVIFNVSAATVALVFIIPLKMAVTWFSDLVGIAPDDFALHLAVFHTLFNIIGVLIISPLVGPLITLLERVVPATEPEVSKPRYLTVAVAAFPVTLRAAVAKEVEHLFANATELIVHGLNLHRHQLYAAEDVGEYVTGAREIFDLDFDQTYEQRIKVLYGAILEYVNYRPEGDIPGEIRQRLYELREAAEYMVRAVKEVKRMRRNTSAYTRRDRGAVTALYNDLRIELARILIELNDLANADPEDRSVLWLEEERERVQVDKKQARRRVEALMREGRLKPNVASSFLNDAHYAYRAMKEMLEGARLLYAEADPGMSEVERLLAMDDDDLNLLDDDDDIEDGIDPIAWVSGWREAVPRRLRTLRQGFRRR